MNYYHILEIGRNAKDSDIKNAYRRLALKWHPQKDPDNTEGHLEKFRDIAEAYTVLSDVQRRSKFDQYGSEGLKDGVMEESEYRGYQYVGDPMALFADYFGTTSPHTVLLNEYGGKFGLNRRQLVVENPSSEDTEMELMCTLEELYKGATKFLKVQRQRFDRDMKSIVDSKCLTIKCEPGWKPGTRLRFKGEGNQIHPVDKKASDIIFTVLESPHPTFERVLESYDLLYIHKCTLMDALCGHMISLDMLDESKMNLHVSETVSSGYEKRIIDHGMPKPDKTYGDLIIRWDIKFPELTSEQKNAIKEILK